MEENKYSIYYQFAGKIVDEFKSEINKDNKSNFDRLVSLQQEIFFRVLRPQLQNKELRADILQNIEKKAQNLASVFNSYSDYKDGNIEKQTFLNKFLKNNNTAMNDIKAEMINKPQQMSMQEIKNESSQAKIKSQENDTIRRNR